MEFYTHTPCYRLHVTHQNKHELTTNWDMCQNFLAFASSVLCKMLTKIGWYH
jgi:hypothetical protein